MGSEWLHQTLGDLIELKRGYDLPKRLREEGLAPIISSSGISDYHSQSKIKSPGVITGRYGTIGEVFYSDIDFWPLNTTLYVRDFKGNDPKFIYYFLKTIPFQQYNDKAAVPGLNRNHLHMAEVVSPTDIKEQRHIAHILSALDNKIQLNRQTNQTLEQMAQGLFKSWFVDFDPVIDNALAAGKPIPEELQARAQRRQQQLAKPDHQPLPDDVLQLFPSEFEETEELGWVPKGWRVEQLVNKISILNGFAFKSKDYTESGTFVLRTKNFKCGMTQKLHDDVYLPDNFLSTHESYLSKPYDYHLVMVGNSLGNRGIIFPQQLPALRNQNMWCFRTKDENVVSQVYVKFILDSIVTKSLG
ncbi:MAG: restriction endonuclease subunit S, partial [Paraglaciecola chathamensis]